MNNNISLINSLHDHANDHTQEIIGELDQTLGHAHEHTGIVGLIDYFMFDIFNLDQNSKLIQATSIILSDLLNILILLVLIITTISFIQTYIPYKKMEKFASKLNPIVSIVVFSLFGLISPTCICTAIPIFIGILSLGIPLYSAICFLISGALINIPSLIVMYNIIGPKFTNIYFITSIIISIATGIIIYIIKIKGNVVEDGNSYIYKNEDKQMKIPDRIKFSFSNLFHIIRKNIVYILISLIFSALFSLFVPLDLILSINESSILFMFVGIFIGLILHMDIISISPLVSSMLNADIHYFILVPFLISTAFFSIPSIFILKKYINVKSYLKISGIVLILVCLSGVFISFLY